MVKTISLLGATGSIGTQSIDVVLRHPEQFKINSLSFGENVQEGAALIERVKPKCVAVKNEDVADQLRRHLSFSVSIITGMDGLIEVASDPEADVVVNALVGSIGLAPTLAAIHNGKMIALANKETLVTAGHIVMEAAKEKGVTVFPVDSEHSAIFQALNGEKLSQVDRLIITASGGSFRDKRRDELENVTVKEALNHPNWAMGAKLTVDSATMMNKGLEVIEAHWLFDMPYEKIDVVIHRESIVHSLVEYDDKSVIAQLGTPDMRVPIQYALSYPDRLELADTKRLNLLEIGTLHFDKMDYDRFRCLKMAFDAGMAGGTMPTVLNAANEVAVSAFLNGTIKFLEIEKLVSEALWEHSLIERPDLETIGHVDSEVRARTEQRVQALISG